MEMGTLDPAKEVQKVIWSLGDYRELSRHGTYGEELVDAVGVAAGMEVLDVAAGTGKVALAAAARGAQVIASDLTPAMIEWGRSESAAAGLEIEWMEADAEDLPFEPDRFDRVLSSFGAQFTPRRARGRSGRARRGDPRARPLRPRALLVWRPVHPEPRHRRSRDVSGDQT